MLSEVNGGLCYFVLACTELLQVHHTIQVLLGYQHTQDKVELLISHGIPNNRSTFLLHVRGASVCLALFVLDTRSKHEMHTFHLDYVHYPCLWCREQPFQQIFFSETSAANRAVLLDSSCGDLSVSSAFWL